MPFELEIRPRFRDIDAMNHVNNAVYFTYMEQAHSRRLSARPRVGDAIRIGSSRSLELPRVTHRYVRSNQGSKLLRVRRGHGAGGPLAYEGNGPPARHFRG